MTPCTKFSIRLPASQIDALAASVLPHTRRMGDARLYWKLVQLTKALQSHVHMEAGFAGFPLPFLPLFLCSQPHAYSCNACNTVAKRQSNVPPGSHNVPPSSVPSSGARRSGSSQYCLSSLLVYTHTTPCSPAQRWHQNNDMPTSRRAGYDADRADLKSSETGWPTLTTQSIFLLNSNSDHREAAPLSRCILRSGAR
eukprot:365325-Chlamydomonas_euryale.AAC.18